jgi:hypothetical protein
MDDLVKSTIIDGVAATEDRDSQNEILELDGANIAQMTRNGMFNDNHGSGFINTLGRITEAKKIYKASDAKTDREKHYWSQYNRPFLYVKGYLFDGEESDHPNAKAVSAIMKEFKKAGTPLDVKMSVEGKVLKRGERGLIKESMVRNVALTLVPANKNTGSMVIGDTMKKHLMDEIQNTGGDAVYAHTMLKSMGVEVVDDESYRLQKILGNVELINNMMKALSVGYGGSGAPGSQAGGAVLTPESHDKKKVKNVTLGKKSYKKDILKALIKRVVQQYPSMSIADVVKYSMKSYKKKFGDI